MKKNRNILITLCLILIVFFSGLESETLLSSVKKKSAAQKRSTPVKILKKSIKKSKSTKKKLPTRNSRKKKKKKSRRRVIPPIKMKYPDNFEVIRDTSLCHGVTYKEILYGEKFKHHIHLIEADIFEDDLFAQVIKANNNNKSLEKLQNIVKSYQQFEGDTVVSAVNANFWQAVTNYPIGPTIVDGELVEMITHKKWSSAFFNSESKMYIDNYFISGDIMNNGKYVGSIKKVNRRGDSTGLIIYNKFAGDAVPYISSVNIAADIQSLFNQLQSEDEYRDSSDIEIDSANIVRELIIQKQMSNIEFHLYKSVCTYLTDPAVNKPIKCIVRSLNQGVVNMPEYGCIISYGVDYNKANLPKPGDTIVIKFSTNNNQDIKFFQGVSGTPRLVRNGKPTNEAYVEGSRANRFIKSQLPRTAIGTDKNRDRIFLVAVEGTVRSEYIAGTTLDQLAFIMQKIGAWNAMNLDGGGSTVMVIDGKNILFPSKPDLGRRVSVGLGVLKIKDEK